MHSARPALGWLDAPSDISGLHFAEDDGSWSFVRYAELARRVEAIASVLEHDGVLPGDVVTLVLPSGAVFAAAFFAVQLVGAIPTVVVPPIAFESVERYVHAVTRALEATGSTAVYT